jgi:hypothetical protein
MSANWIVISTRHCPLLARLQPVAPRDSRMRALRRMSSPVYDADFLLRAAKVRGRNLRSPHITYTT